MENSGKIMKINVVGTSGAGKSTLARRLSEALSLPYIEMDALLWLPDWQERPDAQLFEALETALTASPGWVLDGNYTRTLPVKWARVQGVVWLDLGFARTVFRVTRRALRRSLTGREIWPGTGNRESLPKTFLSRDSIVWWAIKTHRPNRERLSWPR